MRTHFPKCSPPTPLHTPSPLVPRYNSNHYRAATRRKVTVVEMIADRPLLILPPLTSHASPHTHTLPRYNSDHYRAATWRKVTVVERIVDWGFNVLHSDVDVVWFQDPLPYFLGPKIQDVDVAVSTGKCGACGTLECGQVVVLAGARGA